MTKSMYVTSERVRVNLPARIMASIYHETSKVQEYIEPASAKMPRVMVVRKKNRIHHGPRDETIRIFNKLLLNKRIEGTLTLK